MTLQNIKEKVLKEVEKRLGFKVEKGSVYKSILLDGVDFTLAEVGKVINEEVIVARKKIVDKEDDFTELAIIAIEEYSEELKQKLEIK